MSLPVTANHNSFIKINLNKKNTGIQEIVTFVQESKGRSISFTQLIGKDIPNDSGFFTLNLKDGVEARLYGIFQDTIMQPCIGSFCIKYPELGEISSSVVNNIQQHFNIVLKAQIDRMNRSL